MSLIERISSKIEQLKKLISSVNNEIAGDPDNFALSMEQNSLKNLLEDLEEQLHQENLKREKEFKGEIND